MTSTSTQDDLLSDDPFYTVVGNTIEGSYVPASSGGATDGSTTGSVMSVTSGGITINLILDAAAQAAPASFKNGLQQAVAILAANITDKITVNIKIDYSGTGGGASAGPDNGYYENYSWVRSELLNNASAGDTTFNSLPSGSTIQGQSNVAAWYAQLKLWGVIAANDTTTDDASANFSTDINPNLLVGVALHELTHAMGRVPYGSAPDVFDFYRFTSAGVRLFSGGATAPAAYFSLDGGVTKLADYGRSSDPSDFLNSGVQGPNDPFNEYYTSSTLQGLTSIDLQQLDALGFHVAAGTPTTIEVYGATSLVQAGGNYFMDPVAGGAGPSLKYGGTSVTVGTTSSWSPIGAEQVSGGYDVVWKNSSTGMFSFWSTDGNGNFVTHLAADADGSSATVMSLETTFHQDLNGDGVIGAPSVTIEAAGSTSLILVGSNYYLDSMSTGTGPTLKHSGSAVTVGTTASWSPIGAEQVSGGYDIVWKDSATGMFSFWSTDSNGNFVTHLAADADGSSTTVRSLETTFHQDLNGDGVIGAPSITIEAAGSTSLILVGSNYYLDSMSTGTGPTLKHSGSAVTVGTTASWSPIGAEQVSGGYDVVWKDSSTGMFSFWSTDGNGNFVTHLAADADGSSTTVMSLETTFHQDLNGDGVIGASSSPTTIEAAGSTSLVLAGSNYYLDSMSTGTGPTLKHSGSAVTVGTTASWSPIGAEQVSGGYDVVWKDSATGMFSFWSTDSNGNFVTHLAADADGSSTTVASLETTFHQDLNGDGVVGAQISVSTGLNILDQPVYHGIHASATPDLVFSSLHDVGFLIR